MGNRQNPPPTRNQKTTTELTKHLQPSSSQSDNFTDKKLRVRGGRLEFRFPPNQAALILKEHVAPRLKGVPLTPTDLLKAYAYAKAESRGIRGGAIYDYLHLVAARKTGATHSHTLNVSDYNSFQRRSDPEILGI
jgi:hypothetical protein